MDWTRLSPEEAARILKTDLVSGLTKEEAKKRLALEGPNRWADEKAPNPLVMFLRQFLDPIVIILLVALVVSGFVLGEWLDAGAIGVILVLNSVLGFVQEYRAEKALSALKKLSSPKTNVLRSGEILEVDTEELVRGDIVLLAAGDKVPADGRLFDAKHLLVDESSLTGESVAVDKQTQELAHETRLVGEKRNMAFLGTSVVKGRGALVVTSTAKATELGKVAESLSEKEDSTPLEKDLKKLGGKILFICLGASALVFFIGLFNQVNWLETLLIAISLAVAAIPEGLPAAVTISLALGVRRMAERRSIVRRLHAVETLGATTFICTDKTGTLTENIMKVEKLIPLHQKDEGMLIRAMLLCNDTRKSGELYSGDPTETALVRFAETEGFDFEEMKRTHPRVDEIAFDSDRKMMTTLHRWDRGFISMTKGAPENIITLSANLDSQARKQWLERCDELSRNGFRLLGFAEKEVNLTSVNASLEKDMRFLGIIAESDPPRKEVAAALAECRKAGIGVAMITGDHVSTAKAIGSRIGLEGDVMSGEELAEIDDEVLHDKIEDIAVYARVSPLQKVKILEALKYRGHVVAMTGDGVNDAPALKKSDIGVAMGITGTDVAVEASQMILTDDNFATIVSAIKEGRLIFSNIKKFVHFLLSCNVSEVLSVLIASLLGMPFPLFPIQILWINLVTDGLPALALGTDKPTMDLMAKPPRKTSEGIITQMGLLGILIQGLILTSGVIAAYALELYVLPQLLGYKSDLGIARTVTFATLVLSQLLHAFNFRVEKSFIISRETFKNMFLNISFLASLALQALVIFLSPLQVIFKTSSLNWIHLIVAAVASIVPAIGINIFRRHAKRFA